MEKITFGTRKIPKITHLEHPNNGDTALLMPVEVFQTVLSFLAQIQFDSESIKIKSTPVLADITRAEKAMNVTPVEIATVLSCDSLINPTLLIHSINAQYPNRVISYLVYKPGSDLDDLVSHPHASSVIFLSQLEDSLEEND